MDFEAIWHTHKPFIIKVAAGALIFLIGTAIQGSMMDTAEKLSNTNASRQAEVQAKIEQLKTAEALEQGRGNALQSQLQPAILEALEWKPAEGFVLPDGEAQPHLFYPRAVNTALREIEAARDRALRLNPGAPLTVPKSSQDLGLPQEVSEADVDEALAQLDVVRGVVVRLLDAGIRDVREVRPRDVAYQEQPGVGGYLRQVPLQIEFVGGSAELARALSEFQKTGSFLEVLACEVTRAGDRPEDPIVVSLEVQALTIVPSLPAGQTVKDDAGGGSRRGGRRRTRRFGRDR
jgi:hypothetical protein